jgi:hypothetical protein
LRLPRLDRRLNEGRGVVETSPASPSQLAVIPAVETPFQSSVVIGITLEIWRNGFAEPALVRMSELSSVNGTANPPALPVRLAARASRTAACSVLVSAQF